MLGSLIGLLEQGEALAVELEAMGARHAGYGVQESHYATVSTALLTMLTEVLGAEFTGETKEAWTTLYQTVETMMRRGAAAAVASC